MVLVFHADSRTYFCPITGDNSEWPKAVTFITAVSVKKTGLYFDPIDDNPGWYSQKWRHDPSSLIVAVDNKRIVGTVMFSFDPVLSVIAHLGVLPKYRRMGVGRTLLRMAMERIADKGGNYVAGYIVHTNRASLELCKQEGLQTFDVPLTAAFRSLRQ
jgi:ribosomal protein S18 acetylase RimI-like enzyme